MTAGADALVDLSRWPLVGRDDELAMAREAVSELGGVVLSGAAGVGKTRLAREVLTLAAGGVARTEWIAATASAASVPLGAAAHLIPRGAVGRGRDATLRAVLSAFERERGRDRLLLGVDDAHLLDDASAALVHLLATTGTAAVVVTVRSGEPAPDSIVALWKDGPAPLVVVQALARHEVGELVTSFLGGPVDGALLHLLWESSAGNVLYLRELVRHGIESGALRRDKGLWRWLGSFEPGERLHDLIAMRMGALTEDERATLELVAVGEPVTVGCLRALGVAECAERLERRGLLASRRAAATEVGLAHPLFGEELRAHLPSARLDEVRLRLADALEAKGSGDAADRFRIGLWRADAGDTSRPDELRAAARRAWSLWAAPVGERLARAAMASGPDLEAGYLLGEALSDQGRHDDALDAWRAVEDLPGPDRIRAPGAKAPASTLNFNFNRADDARVVLRRAAERVDDRGARHVLEGALSFFDATGRSAVSSDPDDIAVASPQGVLGATLRWTAEGRLDRTVAAVDEAIASSRMWVEEFPTPALLLQVSRVWARLLAGHISEAESEAELQYATAVATRADYPRLAWCLVRGLVAVMRGCPRRASDALREGLAVAGADDRGWVRPMHAYLAMAASLVGDVETADDHERRAAAANRSIDGVFAVDVRRARAWVRAARGELTAAVEEASAAADEAAAGSQAALEAFALHDMARFGSAIEVADQLGELSHVVDGRLVDALAAHARALADAAGSALDAAATTFATLGLDLFAAEASAAAARAHRSAGRRASAYAARTRAQELAARCEGARTPALAWIDQPDDLSAREREVAMLAATGLPSRAIADRLGITVRTVDNLLGRVYVKLAVSGRRELVEVLGSSRE